jgi:hypothetical protein
MAIPLADASDAPEQLWDGGPWDMEEGLDFPEAGWRHLACEMKAIAMILGGTGHAAEIVHRDLKGNVKSRTFRWQYLARQRGWRGGL